MEPEIVKTTITPLKDLLPEIYGDALKPGMKAVGHAIGDALEMCLLPITAMGYVPKLAKKCLDKHLKTFEQKLNKIPEDKKADIHPQISIPVIQKLLYTTNDTIAELFINLLTSSANIDMCSNAHPGFVEIISQLSPDEAKIIQYLNGENDIQYAEIKAYVKNGTGYNTILPKSTLTPFHVALDFPNNIHAYYSNLIRLGILEDESGTYKIANNVYDEIAEKYNFDYYKKLVPECFKKVVIEKSYYEVTSFGRLFISACSSTTK